MDLVYRRSGPKRVELCCALCVCVCARARAASMNHQPFEHPELAGEELVSHTFVDFINGILMDESLENYSSTQLLTLQSNRAYQLIFNGFQDILMNDKASNVQMSSLSTSTCRQHDYCCSGHDAADDLLDKHGSLSTFGKSVDRLVMCSNNFTYSRDRASTLPNCAFSYNTEGSFVQTLSEFNEGVLNSSSHVQHLSFDEHNSGTRSSQLPQALEKGEEKDVSYVMNADLAAERYAHLFDEWQDQGVDEVTLLGAGRADVKHKGRDDAALGSAIDIKALLLSSAKALGEGDIKKATELLQHVQQHGASAHGTGLQRVAHYFSEAMMARISGMGSTLYTAITSTSQLPSAWMMLKAYKMVFEVCPYLKTAHYFANQYILKVSNGASHLHIVDYGIFYGFQWPCLIYALAHREGGPPFVRITGIELPTKPIDINPSSTTEGTGRRLAEYAKSYNVPFEYHSVLAENWEDIGHCALHTLPGEVLVLNSFNRLRHLQDESDGVSLSARDRLLRQMHALKPHLLVTGFMNASHSSPFFVPRFREALHYYCNKFDTLHTILFDDSLERGLIEREVMGRAILNVVACEGINRVERPEVYKQWHTRIERAGFRPRPLLQSVLSTAKAIMKGYHKDFSLLQDSNAWMLLGWRGRVMQSLSAWEPSKSIN